MGLVVGKACKRGRQIIRGQICFELVFVDHKGERCTQYRHIECLSDRSWNTLQESIAGKTGREAIEAIQASGCLWAPPQLRWGGARRAVARSDGGLACIA